MFWRLLLESFVRQRRRKALAGVAILLGTTAVTAMLALATTIGDRIHRELAVYGANIVVTPAAEALAVKVGGVDVRPASGGAHLKQADLLKLRTIFWANNITGVSPELDVKERVKFPQSSSGPAVVTVKKLWFDHDLAGLQTGAPQLHPWWELSGGWPAVLTHHEDFVQVVVGSSLANRNHLKLGDGFTLGDGFESAQVSGIVVTGDDTDNDILMRLRESRPGSFETDDPLSRVEISARTKPEDPFARKDPDTLTPRLREIWYCRPYANSIAYQIREAIPGAEAEQVRQVEQSEGTILEKIGGLMWLVSGAALLAAGFAVSAAMATAVLERRGEIGLMRSLGAGKGRVAMLFYAETGLLALVAGTAGYLGGSGLAAWLGARIFDGHGSTLAWAGSSGVFNPVLLPVVVGLGLLVALAGSTPSIRGALRVSPSAILREDG